MAIVRPSIAVPGVRLVNGCSECIGTGYLLSPLEKAGPILDEKLSCSPWTCTR
jgi:hypothetical protein